MPAGYRTMLPARRLVTSAGRRGLSNAVWLGAHSASHIATTTTCTAPNRKWVVEWRNVYRSADIATGSTVDDLTVGTATVAAADFARLTTPAGARCRLTYRPPVLRPGTGLRFDPPR